MPSHGKLVDIPDLLEKGGEAQENQFPTLARDPQQSEQARQDLGETLPQRHWRVSPAGVSRLGEDVGDLQKHSPQNLYFQRMGSPCLISTQGTAT